MDSKGENNKFMIYPCVICQQQAQSVIDLHYHQMQAHSVEELSFGILSIQGLQVAKDAIFKKPKPHVGYKSNDCNIAILNCGSSVNSIKLSNVKVKNKRIFPTANFEKDRCISTHDQTTCLLNCNPFVPWEKELYKAIKVNDEEFVNSAAGLCKDLVNMKQKSRKKNFLIEKDIKKENIEEINIPEKQEEAKEQMQEMLNNSAGYLEASPGSQSSTKVANGSVDNQVGDMQSNGTNINGADIFKIIGIDCGTSSLMFKSNNTNSIWNFFG